MTVSEFCAVQQKKNNALLNASIFNEKFRFWGTSDNVVAYLAEEWFNDSQVDLTALFYDIKTNRFQSFGLGKALNGNQEMQLLQNGNYVVSIRTGKNEVKVLEMRCVRSDRSDQLFESITVIRQTVILLFTDYIRDTTIAKLVTDFSIDS